MVLFETAMLIFAGVQAVSNASSAYSAYRSRHPGRIQTGRMPNYTTYHQGYNMMVRAPQPIPFYQNYTYLLQQQNYANYTTVAPPFQRQGSAPSAAQAPRLSRGAPAYVSNSLRSVSLPHGNRTATEQHRYRLGGELIIINEQQAPDTYEDHSIGLNTGRRPGYNRQNMHNHWTLFQTRYTRDYPATIAVVNWTRNVITMFIHNPDWDQYFRNYRVLGCNLDAFARENRSHQVFSGIIEGSMVAGTNDPFTMVEDDGLCDFDSSNCWSLLGVSGRVRGERVFVEMMRAAVFGLIQCRYVKPSLMNVDMIGDEDLQFVHVDSSYKNLETKGDCCFSVFSFNTNGWSRDRVLVG